MTRKELSQIYYLSKELKMWKEESQKLQDRIESTGKWLDGMPRGSDISDKVGNLAAALADARTMVVVKELEIQTQRRRIIDYIDKIDDSLLRQIIFYRCVSCMQWREVSQTIGGISETAAKQSFSRYLREGSNGLFDNEQIGFDESFDQIEA